MKLTAILVAVSCLTAQAFGVSPSTRQNAVVNKPSTAFTNNNSLRKQAPASSTSVLFKDGALTRGGAVPGWAAYNEALDKHPLTAKAFTSLVGWLLGDLLAQVFIIKSGIDIKRLITLSAFGFLYHGPSGHYFYNWLDSQIPGTDGKTVAIKVAIDQILWCPVFMTVFFTYLGLVNGDSFATISNKIRSDLFTAMKGSWKVWPFVHTVNFKFISTKHRLVFINGVQIAFNMFLSLLGSK
jgi:protein Mpv17